MVNASESPPKHIENRKSLVIRRKKLSFAAILLVASVASVVVRKHSDDVERSVPAILDDPKIVSLSEKAIQQKLAVQRAPRDAAIRWKLADTYQKLGAIDRAQEQLKAIGKLEPKAVEAPLALANTYLAYKQWSEAEQVYRGATLQAPNNSKAWAGLAITLYHQKKYFEAIEPARKSVHLNSEDPNTYFVAAHCSLEYALQYPDPSFHATQLKNAIKHFNKILRIWPDHGDIYYSLGRAHSALKERKEAIKSLRRARELLPLHVPSGVLLAEQYQATNKLDAAQQLTKQLLIQAPQNAEVHSLMGQLLQKSADPNAPQRALEAFQKAIKLQPNNSFLHVKYGTACLQVGKTEMARQAFTEAIRLNPHAPFPYQQLSSVYSRQKETKLAAEFSARAKGMMFNQQQQQRIERLSQGQPENVSWHLILAERYQSLGQVNIARSQYLLALKYDPRNQRAQAGLKQLPSQPRTLKQ